MNYVLIIGAKSDLAIELAKKYAEHGYDLYLAARNSSDLKCFAKDLHIRTSRVIKILDFDILDYTSHEIFYDNLEIKPIGVIIVSGYLGVQNTAEINFKETLKIIDTNFTGAVSFLNIVVNDFEIRKKGFIIGVSSVAGDRGRKSNYYYGH